MSPKKYAFRIILIFVVAIMGECALFAEPTPLPASSPAEAGTPFPGLVVLEFPEATATPEPTPEPTPTPVPSPPAFTPDQEVVNFIVKGNPFTNPPWLFPQTTDPAEPAGVSRFTTFLISTFEPHITKCGDACFKIEFKP